MRRRHFLKLKGKQKRQQNNYDFWGKLFGFRKDQKEETRRKENERPGQSRAKKKNKERRVILSLKRKKKHKQAEKIKEKLTRKDVATIEDRMEVPQQELSLNASQKLQPNLLGRFLGYMRNGNEHAELSGISSKNLLELLL